MKRARQKASKRDPFFAGRHFGIDSFYIDAQSRLERVKEFSADDCRDALALTDLQKTVRAAIARRLKRLKETA